MAVVGAGASGTEIASAYARMGVGVTLFEALDRVLPTEDADVSKVADRSFKKQGITVHTGTFVQDIEAADGGVSFTHGEESGQVDWRLVIATGRGADVEGLGLEEAGVKLGDDGLVTVDGALRTSAAGVWAIGDLVPGRRSRTRPPTGVIAAEAIAGRETHPIEYGDIPRATFCTPNVGSFGLTEEQAREAGHDVVVGKLQYGAVGAGTVYGDRTGLVKIIGDKRYGELLGGHIVGTRATELIQELVNVKALEGGFPGRADRPRPSDAVGGRDGGPRARPAGGSSTGERRRLRVLLRPRLARGVPRRGAHPATDAGGHPVGPGPGARPAGRRRVRGFRCAEERDIALQLVERRAAERGLQPVRWPDPLPFDSAFAMRAATFARQIGRSVAFAQAAFRQAYLAGGRSTCPTTSSSRARPARSSRGRAACGGAALRARGAGGIDRRGGGARRALDPGGLGGRRGLPRRRRARARGRAARAVRA